MRNRLGVAALLVLTHIAVSTTGLKAASAEPASAPTASDPENTLYLDLDYGRVVIRLRPDLAPVHVERIKHLTRAGFYDGTVFHRVIDGFVAQTGDPTGKGSGGSGRLLNAEFTRTPQVRGVVAMAKGARRNSADSQWFIVLADNRAMLDGKYTVWGEVTAGMEFVDMIRKGDAKRDGKVETPDRLVRLRVAADADQAPAAQIKAAEVLQRPDAAATARNFTASEFRCVVLVDGTGLAALSVFAKLWTHGYLAGYYKAQDKLTFAGTDADTLAGALAETCKAHPAAFLLTAAQHELASAARDLPPTTAAFSPRSYSCKDYGAARNGADKREADFAELWSFAFIQGFKNASQPDLEIPFEARSRILGAVTVACQKLPDLGFLDLTALVAAKVKLK